MQQNPFPLRNPFLLNGELIEEGFESSRFFLLVPYLLFQGSGSGGGFVMDFSKVGEKILSSVKSARSLGLLPSTSDRPEVPARVAAAAAVARALAGLPPHQRYNLPTSSEELSSIYGSRPPSQGLEELEEGFYEEEFDPVRYILEHISSEESELEYFEKQASLRLGQLDIVAEKLSRHVMEHHEVMVKGMHLVRELERDLKLATVICMNGRRRLTSSMNEVSRDLIVNSKAKKKQYLMDMLPILNDLRRAMEMQDTLEVLVDKENYCKAFQLLSEYLQLLDSLSELSVVQEMSCGVESWLGKTLHKLDSLLMAVCLDFKEERYITVVDAYALIGDISGLAEKIQSFFMQEVLTESHSVLKSIVQADQEMQTQTNRLTYSDLCLQIPDSKFRQCLLETLAVLFQLMCSYDEIMTFHVKNENENGMSRNQKLPPGSAVNTSNSVDGHCDKSDLLTSLSMECRTSSVDTSGISNYLPSNSHKPVAEARESSSVALTSGFPWYELRKEATAFVSQTLQRGRKNLWQLITSRVSVLLSSSAACSTSIHQFLKNYEDLNVFIISGESFCGAEAVEFRQKLKAICENYYSAFHQQNISALKMVLEKETWIPLPSDTVEVVSFAGLVGNEAPVIVQSHNYTNSNNLNSTKPDISLGISSKENGFSNWCRSSNPFMQKLTSASESSSPNGTTSRATEGNDDKCSPRISDSNHMNCGNSVSEDESEDLLADFIDEDSQLPSRIAKSSVVRRCSLRWSADDCTAQTGSSLCLLRSMDKYARLMQKLDLINIELFKGVCQLFGVFFYFVYETFGQQSASSGKGSTEALNYRLRTALSRITQDCDQWLKPLSSSSHASLNDVMPSPPATNSSIGLKEICTATDTLALVSRIMHRSRAHLQSLLLQNSAVIVDDFYAHLVDCVPDLMEHIQRRTARQLLHINVYVDRIVTAKWELKELGMEHNGYVDLLLGEFKHYKTRLVHGGIHNEVQGRLLQYSLDIVAETLVEGLSRVKRCTDEGRALMSLDLQVLINGLQQLVSFNVRPKLQIVDTFIKAYYLPETEYVHWARAHPEYTRSQIVGLINLVATMKGWKRKTRLEVLEKIEA